MKNTKKTNFDEFLFSHFNIKENKAANEEAVALSNKKESFFNKGLEVNYHEPVKQKAVVSRSVVEREIESRASDAYEKEQKVASLAEVLESIPDKVRELDLSDLAGKHESEWYHTFRDLKDEIESEIGRTHHDEHGKLSFKTEIKEFWDELEEYIEKLLLELERIFQAFPQMSRIALLYLLSIIISVPLVFMSVDGQAKLSVADNDKQIPQVQLAQEELPESFELTPEMKSAIVAKNSSKIINSGKVVYQVTEGTKKNARVAGAYEEIDKDSLDDKSTQIKQKIFRFYKYLMNLKDDLSGGIK